MFVTILWIVFIVHHIQISKLEALGIPAVKAISGSSLENFADCAAGKYRFGQCGLIDRESNDCDNGQGLIWMNNPNLCY